MRFGVLGAAQVRRGAEFVDLGTRKQRALVAALALHAGRTVPVDTIIDLLWGDDPPGVVSTTLQAYISGLRKALEPARERRAPAAVLVTVGAGYALRLAPGQLDAARFADLVAGGHQRLAPYAALVPRGTRARSPSRAELLAVRGDLDEALGLWRGEPYLELGDAHDARAERARLDELRTAAEEDRAFARLALGEHSTVAAELEALTAAYPLRERLWGLRALALTRAGRQADALHVLRRVRTLLQDELGLDPGPDLRALQGAVLRQDPALAWVPPSEPGAASTWSSGPAVNAPALNAPASKAPASKAPASEPPASTAPLIGRTQHVQLLRDLVTLVERDPGRPRFASLVGEAGIGKSRLAAELSTFARGRGWRVVVGACSQDDGAPPLWPWTTVLRELGLNLPTAAADDAEPAPFTIRDQLCRLILRSATDRPLLIVLDDLHWADTATLRVLTLLTEMATEASGTGPTTAPAADGAAPASARLVVLATWRSHPPPTGALADVVEALARRHSVRLVLAGLSAAESAQVVAGLAAPPTASEAGTLRARTDGNPFFLIEYARLAAERGDLGSLLAEPDPPRAIGDVLIRRLDRLPLAARRLLTTAAVIGRSFDLTTLAGAAGAEPEDALDALDVCTAAGLVREEGVDAFAFEHALVRDTAYAELSPSRRARVHARVAEALSSSGRETELARHWAAAGPAHVHRAWPAAVSAARLARRLHAHDEAAGLLEGALAGVERDPAAGTLDRYEVLMQLIEAYRWSARWSDLVSTVELAIAAAEEVGDPQLIAHAAISTSIEALWQSAQMGEQNERVVAALRASLAALPDDDSAIRCRVLLSLANETYYVTPYAERCALVDEAAAMAERLDDDRLRLDVDQITFTALWSNATAPRRLAATARAVKIAARLGEEQAGLVASTLRAVVESELGLVPAMRVSIQRARAEAERLRIPYGRLVLDCLELSWLALAGDTGRCDALLARLETTQEQIAVESSGDAAASARLVLDVWRGRAGDAAEAMREMEGGPLPVTPIIAAWLLRAGRRAEAVAHLAAHEVWLGEDDWFAMLSWGSAAEVAAALGDAALGAQVEALLIPYAGRSCQAGSSNAMGPVDAFLALAATAQGARDRATQYAERAAALTREWEIPLAAAWLGEQRARYGW